jgi:hypothetical protein
MPMSDIENYKNYKRFPIQLSSQTIMLIHLFNNENNNMRNFFEMEDIEENSKVVQDYERNQNPANQFFKQLEGQYSDAFLEDIIIEATRLLTESDDSSNRLATLVGDTYVNNSAKEALIKAESIILNKRNVLIEKT